MFIAHYAVFVVLYLWEIEDCAILGAFFVSHTQLVVDFLSTVEVGRLSVFPRYDCAPRLVLHPRSPSYERDFLRNALVPTELRKHDIIASQIIEPVKSVIRRKSLNRTGFQLVKTNACLEIT